jgi:hypothetical protein
MGCAGRLANGINTVHLSYVRERIGHALIGARQWIPAEHLGDPDTAAGMGILDGLAFRTKGQLAIDICTDAYADGVTFDSPAATRYTATAPSYASSSNNSSRPTCCASARTSSSR